MTNERHLIRRVMGLLAGDFPTPTRGQPKMLTNEARQAIERRIIERVIDDALADETIWLSADDEAPTREKHALIESCLAADEVRLHYHHGDVREYFGWAYFVQGNDGWDVLADHTMNIQPFLKGAEELAESLSNDGGA